MVMFGARLKQARIAAQFSERALAEKVGVSANAISKYERGLMSPDSKVMVRVAEALDTPLDFFFRAEPARITSAAYRKCCSLGEKKRKAIEASSQEWVERYLEVESLFLDQQRVFNLHDGVSDWDKVEEAAEYLRREWRLGLDPIENLMDLLEDHGVKVGQIAGFDGFDACTFYANDQPVIILRRDAPGDRQRFSLAHELGHLLLQIEGNLDEEQAANRFAGAFLAPAEAARGELGAHRTHLHLDELVLLKREYGLSMGAWIHRAADLSIISASEAERLYRLFSAHGWRKQEPGPPYPPEESSRFRRLVSRALAEDLISRSKAAELLGDGLAVAGKEEISFIDDLVAVPAGY